MAKIDAAVEQLTARLGEALGERLAAAQAGRNREPQALLAAADELAQLMRKVAYEALTEAAGRYEEAPLCPGCSRPMERHDRVWRPVLALGGPLRGRFPRFRCRGCRRGACPSLERLGLRRGCEPRLVAAALKLCAHESFELAEAILAGFGVSLSDNTLQRLAHEVGSERVKQREAAVAAVMAQGYRNLPGRSAPPRLYIMVDGFKAKVAKQWREPRCAVIFETPQVGADERNEPPARERVSVLATLGDCATVAAWVTEEVQRRNVAEAAEVILVGDGAPWIWEHVADVLPKWVKRTETLDWYHLCEHLALAAEGDAKLLEELRDRAWVGDTNLLLDQLRALREAASGERLRVLTNVLKYVLDHRWRMDYQNKRADGYHVGSGSVESCCRQLGNRVKAGGTNWTARGINAVLHLLADELTDDEVRLAA